MTYITLDEAESYTRSTIPVDSGEVEVALMVACELIDDHCVRSFVVPSAATTRVFVPSGSCLLKVDDIANTTDLVIVDDGTTLAATDYQLEVWPGRAEQTDPDGSKRPFQYIRRLSGSWSSTSEASLSITARYGWPDATPDKVKLATKVLVKDLLATRDTRFGFVQVGDFSRRVSENSTVVMLLSRLRSADTIGIA